jgi:hypothetical protein
MKILLAGEISPEWETLEPSRWNQTYRNQINDVLRLIGNSIANNGANEGTIGSIRWRLEPSIAKPADEEEPA